MMKIYGFATHNVTKVLLTAEELGLPYDYVLVDPSKGEQKSPEHMQRHPMGKVPVLEHEGEYYRESAAICRYLVHLSNNRLYGGDDIKQQSLIDEWIDFSTLSLGSEFDVIFFQELVLPTYFSRDPDLEKITQAKALLEERLPFVEQQLAVNRFLAGDELTLADIILFSYVQHHELTSVNIEPYPNLVRWYEEIKNRPSCINAMKHYPRGLPI